MEKYIREQLSKVHFHSGGTANDFQLYQPFHNAQRMKLGSNVVISPMCYLSVSDRSLEDTSRSFNLHIEDDVVIGAWNRIETYEYIWIGKSVVLGANVYLSDRTHQYENVDEYVAVQEMRAGGDLIIGEGVRIGAHSVISGRLTIGRGAVVGPHTVLNNKSVPAHSVVAGDPAVLTRIYDYDDRRWRNAQDISADSMRAIVQQREHQPERYLE